MSPWQRLGIARTEDVTAIRRAYARQLKAIDPEVDPAAFIALREARDRALSWAEYSDQGGEEPDEGGLDAPAFEAFMTEGADDPAEFADGGSRPEPDPSRPDGIEPFERGEPDPFQIAAAELQSILFAEDELAAEDGARIQALTRFLLDDPGLHSIDRAAEVESWLAQEAADGAPRSDPMLPLLVHYFHWEKRHGDWDLDPNIAFLLERWRAYLFREEVLRPGHPDRDAWRELSSAEPRLGWRRWLRRAGVKRLLARIRRDYPAAEGLLEPYRVALWDQHLAPETAKMLKRAAFFFWLVFLAFKIATLDYITGGEQGTATLAAGAVDARLDRMIHALAPGHLTLPALQSADPVLVEKLRARIRGVKRFTTPGPETVQAMIGDIETAYDRNLRAADYALQTRYWQLRADELKWRRIRSGGTCEEPPKGQKPPELPPQLDARRAALTGDVLLARPRKAVEANSSHRYIIPAWLMEATAERSGLGLDRLRPALKDEGPLKDQCSANVALIEVALAKGDAKAQEFVREMTRAL